MIDPTFFVLFAVAVSGLMLVWDTVEVGRNDAANIVNAVFGARIMRRRNAVYIAGLAVILGAWASSPVMETARKGIFDPALLTPEMALTVYVCVYITDTVLLYTFSAFGMPVSTTAQLIFALLGGGFIAGCFNAEGQFLSGGFSIVNWGTSGTVLLGIVVSIIVSGILSFVFHKIFRSTLGFNIKNRSKIMRHGSWIAGFLLTGLFFFMVMKGMKGVPLVKDLKAATIDQYGYFVVLGVSWLILTVTVWLVLNFGGQWFSKNLFAGLAILGMIALAIAFGQNDLANCASPGVASFMIYKHGEVHSSEEVPGYFLLICGLFLAFGMATKTAQRVTRAEVNTGSQGDLVRLYAPKWCVKTAQFLLPTHSIETPVEEHPHIDLSKKTQHYDALRAAVITSFSASVIAFASGMGLPVSTTYVTFAAVIASGWADRIFERGDASLKLGRTIWVVFCWFFSAVLSALTTAVCVIIVFYLGSVGILVGITGNLTIRTVMKKRADVQEARLQEEMAERKKLLISEGEATYASEHDDDSMS